MASTFLPSCVYMICDSYSGYGNHNFKSCDFSVSQTSCDIELMSFLTSHFPVVESGRLTTHLSKNPLFMVESSVNDGGDVN